MIYFARHGESVANRDGYFAGLIDSELTYKGRLQAGLIASQLIESNIDIELIVSSPLIRAVDTTVIVANSINNKKIKIDERFIEYDFGDLTGMPKKGVEHSRFYAAKAREPALDFANRVAEAWNDYAAYAGNVLLIGHGFVGVMIDCLIQKGDVERFNELPTDIANNGVLTSYEQKILTVE